MTKNKILAFNYFGGKYQFIQELIPLFPVHEHYVEVMSGSAALVLNKEASKMDTMNDINYDVINFFKVLRDHSDELIRRLSLTPVSRHEYYSSWPMNDSEDHIENARRFFIRCRMSFQGSGITKSTGFNACVTSHQQGVSKNVAKFYNSIDKLPEVINRLQSIQIESLPYQSIIEKYDRPGTFFYVDPPYELRTRNYKKWYVNEFQDKDHNELSEILKSCKAKVMISGYDSDMYQTLYSDWNFIKLKPKSHSMKGSKIWQECIWTNY